MLSLRNKSSERALFEYRIQKLEERLKIATLCLHKISEGDQSLSYFDIDDSPDDEEGKQFSETLSRTKQRLAEYNQREQQRSWAAEGMAQFIALIQGDRTRSGFFDEVLSMIVRYTKSNQGGIFILNDNDPQDRHLELRACYAYSKKKFVDRKIPIGQGILGQAFLEEETSIFLNVPGNFFDITSGLGEATPRFLLITPLRYDQQVVGVLEIGCFHRMEKHQVEFIEKIAENLASVVLNIQHAAKATALYEESQRRARMLLEQEETLKQNIEELKATQEEMKRHQRGVEDRTQLMKFIIDNIPFPIFVKDERGRYTLVNRSEAELFALAESDILDKDDSYFVPNEDEWRVIQESDNRVLDSGQPLELPIQNFTTKNGASYVFKTTKIPFVNHVTGRKNILGVSIDLTEKHALEKKLLREMNIGTGNTLINLAGRQRMLSQKIGFYAEMVVKGKLHHISELKNTIDLFGHSLLTIRDGGFPKGIPCENPLPPADISVMSYVREIDMMWAQYRDAANKIIYYLTFGRSTTEEVRQYEIEKSIDFIEDNGEKFLELNNDLMLACIRISAAERVEDAY